MQQAEAVAVGGLTAHQQPRNGHGEDAQCEGRECTTGACRRVGNQQDRDRQLLDQGQAHGDRACECLGNPEQTHPRPGATQAGELREPGGEEYRREGNPQDEHGECQQLPRQDKIAGGRSP